MVSTSFTVLTSTESNQWYTPPQIILRVKELIGDIDIDPASCATAQEWIQAKEFYTKEQDGFNRPWRGRLWLNSPYGKAGDDNYGASAWLFKALENYDKGDVSSESLILCRGDSKGLKSIIRRGFAFVDCDRIAFINPLHPTAKSPVPGSKIIYLGKRIADFKRIFSPIGICLRII